MEIRPLVAHDARTARELVERAVSGTPYGELPRLALERALAGSSDESLGLVALQDGRLAGLVLYGLVAGTKGAAKLHLVTEPAEALLSEAVADLARRGARLVVAEVPDDPAVRAWRAPLEVSRFVLEGRVADYHRDGVDLLLLRRDL